jgi:hypothetical protein
MQIGGGRFKGKTSKLFKNLAILNNEKNITVYTEIIRIKKVGYYQ